MKIDLVFDKLARNHSNFGVGQACTFGYLYLLTSRERAKSAPYLRLKNSKKLQSVKYSLLQYPHGGKLKKNRSFYSNFFSFFLSPESRTVPKNLKGGPLVVFEHPFFCKMKKNEGALRTH